MTADATLSVDDPVAIDNAVKQLADGKFARELAPKFGMSAGALRHHLMKHPEYDKSIKDQCISMVENETADALAVSDKEKAIIARVKVDAAHKYARAHNREVFGDNLQVNVLIDISGALLEARQRSLPVASTTNSPIDGQSERITHASPTRSDVSD